MSSKNSFWKGKTVLVTGANGFVGSHLMRELIIQGATVLGVVKNTTPLHPLLKEYKDRFVFYKTSLLDLDAINKLLQEHKVSVIYHLAGQAIVEIGQDSPVGTFEVNVRGTWNILEAARVNKVKKIIIASTTHVYGDNPNLPYKEEYFPQPSRPYETSKACADLLAQSYADTYNMQVEIPRFVNIYGPGDLNFTRLVPRVIQSVLNGKNPHIWDVGAVRDFIYIDDVIDVYKKLAEIELPNEKRVRAVNIGYGEPVKVLTVIKKIIGLADNKKINIIVQSVPGTRENEIKKQYISTEKAERELHWKPKVSISKGIKVTMEWYKEYLKI